MMHTFINVMKEMIHTLNVYTYILQNVDYVSIVTRVLCFLEAELCK